MSRPPEETSMRMRGTMLVCGLVALVGTSRAWAGSECIQDAKATRGQCRMMCDEDFVVARDLCRNIDPECAAGCRAALEACRAPIVTALEQCVDGCRDQLNTNRDGCPKKGRGRDFCKDRANIRAFLCRDECRDSLHVRDGLEACRETFTTCMSGCALPTEPTPGAPVPTATKTDGPKPTEAPPTAQPTEAPQATPTPTEPPKPVPTFSGPVAPR